VAFRDSARRRQGADFETHRPVSGVRSMLAAMATNNSNTGITKLAWKKRAAIWI
jgi:hypothetical protein